MSLTDHDQYFIFVCYISGLAGVAAFSCLYKIISRILSKEYQGIIDKLSEQIEELKKYS